MVARGERSGFGAGAKHIGRRRRLLRARPDRNGAVLEIPALPAERLRLVPRLEDQLHALIGAFAGFRRVQVVAEIFVGGAAQQADDDASRRQCVEHRHLLGDADRVGGRHDRAEQGDLDLVDARGEPGGGDDRRRGENARGIVVLGDADPVEAQLLHELHALDHAAEGFGADGGVIGGGRHRPFAREVGGRDVAAGFEVGDFHGCRSRNARGSASIALVRALSDLSRVVDDRHGQTWVSPPPIDRSMFRLW